MTNQEIITGLTKLHTNFNSQEKAYYRRLDELKYKDIHIIMHFYKDIFLPFTDELLNLRREISNAINEKVSNKIQSIYKKMINNPMQLIKEYESVTLENE
jgi:ribonuclease D